MPKYLVELDGQRHILEGDHPPSEEEARLTIPIEPLAHPQPPSLATQLGTLRPAPFSPPLSEYPPIAANTLNAAGARIPGWLYQHFTGQSIPQPQSLIGKFVNVIGEGAGLMVGAPGLAARGTGLAARAIPGLIETALGRAGIRAAEGGVLGATANLPMTLEHPQQGALAATTTAALNVAIPPMVQRLLHKIPHGKLLTDPQMEAFAQKVRQAAFGSQTAEGMVFDQKITAALEKNLHQISPAVDLVGQIEETMRSSKDVAEKLSQGMLREAKRGNTTLTAMLANRNLAANATAKQIQQIKLTLQAIPSINRALNRLPNVPYMAPGSFRASVSEADMEVLDLIHSTRAKLLSTFPETQEAYQDFSNFMNDYRTILPSLRKGSMEHTILKGLGTSEQRQALRRVLPSEIQDQIRQVQATHQQMLLQQKKTEEFHTLLRRLGVWGAGGVAATVAGQAARPMVRALFHNE